MTGRNSAVSSASPPKPPSKSSRNAPHPTTRKRPRETLRSFAPRTLAFCVSGWHRCVRGELTRGSIGTIPASEETTNTQRFEADSLADEAVNSEPVSVWKFLAFRKMQGDFEKMQRGANCNRAKTGSSSMACMCFSLLTEQGDNHCLAGTFSGKRYKIANHI